MYTYEDIELLAARLVAVADLYCEKDKAIDLCLLAGELRGMIHAGEPANSPYMWDTVGAVIECLDDYDLGEMAYG